MLLTGSYQNRMELRVYDTSQKRGVRRKSRTGLVPPAFLGPLNIPNLLIRGQLAEPIKKSGMIYPTAQSEALANNIAGIPDN